MNRRDCLRSLAAFGVSPTLNMPVITSEPSPLKRTIPSGNEKLTAVGLGTWQTFDVGSAKEDQDPLKEVLTTLVQKGGSVIDSSPMYGRSENVVGDLSASLEINDKLFMATKVWTSGKDAGIAQMNRSFSRLRRTTIDLMQIHNLVDWKTHIRTLRSWKEEGKIRYLGITHYTESSYAEIERILLSEELDFLQVNYSLLSRKAEERLFPLAQEKKVAVLINQPFESGSLFRLTKGKDLPAWASEFDCKSWGQFFLKFILSQTAVTCVIPGTSNPRHMLDNIGAAYGKLPTQRHRDQMTKLVRT
jgi:diketogulonate reductase-like aldo/keto reductase